MTTSSRCVGEPAGKPCFRIAFREFNNDPLCDTCMINRLIEEVERLTTMYATASVELRFDYD